MKNKRPGPDGVRLFCLEAGTRLLFWPIYTQNHFH